jgi:putative membrane protein
MAKKETQEQTQKRILILCVDRDGDIETKAGIKTPLLGRTANLDGAVALALKDPEEPDANAMFEAVRLHDRLQNEKQPEEMFEVATISGSELGGVSADRKLVAELSNLLDSFSANEVILVTDGYSDEAVLPLIESRVPVSSVRRIVIKHSESIEETAALFTKYIRLLVDNPRYARMALGLPGLLVFIFGILWAINNFVYPGAIYFYGIAIVIVVGGFLLIKGFGVDKSAKDFYKWAKEYSPPPLPMQISNYTIFAGILCVAVSVYLGIANVNINVAPFPSDFAGWLAITPRIATFFIKGIMDLLVVGLIIVLLGRSVRLYIERDSKLLRNIALIISVAWSRWILEATANIIYNPSSTGAPIGLNDTFFSNFLYTIIVGILIGVASVLLIFIVNRSTKDFFQKPDKNQATK